ncbi:hypothetical protein B0H34DRAFT_719065 [Crassisporium funariophilum]|nr:hypothetical protein B0H34DRAFT_719065 [Crassisporium funariophilum]
MSNQMIRLRTNLLRLMLLLCCCLRAHQSVIAANVTVQDFDASIVYSPLESWHSSADPCSTCLNPGSSDTYHEAIHAAPSSDPDDLPPVGSNPPPSPSSTPPPAQSAPPAPPATTPPPAAPPAKSSPNVPSTAPSPSATKTDGGKGDDPDSGKDDDSKSGKDKRRAFMPRFAFPRLDPDDIGFSDPPVTVSFNFTGSAIYLFCYQPNSVASGSTPTNMNLSFTLDNVASGVFKHVPSAGGADFTPNTTVFARTGLPEGLHQLVVTVGQDSVFLFDYLVYTSQDEPSKTGNSSGTATTTPLGQTPPSQTIDPSVKKHNIATFGGAVGGSVGVLALFSLGLAISLIRRRRIAARRDRNDAETLRTNGSGDSPHMSGPAPFVPRFFPDTIIPTDPPTYVDALATNHNTHNGFLASLTSIAYSSRQRSYADIPPESPPPPLDEQLPPPPPFPVAISSTANLIPVEGALLPSIPAAERTSHSPDSSVENDTRPLSRASSSRSALVVHHGDETPEPEINHLQEDVLRHG